MIPFVHLQVHHNVFSMDGALVDVSIKMNRGFLSSSLLQKKIG
jgi:hypothetical protein